MTIKALLVDGPSQDSSDRFFGWPTSLLYAVAPSVAAAKTGQLDVEFVPRIFDPVWFVKGENDKELLSQFERVLEREKVDVVCAGAIYDSINPTMQLLERAKKVNPRITTILGGPHFDEAHCIAGLNDIKLRPDLVDVAIAGDGEYALKTTLEAIAGKRSLSEVDWRSVEGKATVYTNGGLSAETSGRPVNLNSLPFMPLHIADVERHRNEFDVFVDAKGKILPTAQMIAARGCPYSCICCSENKTLAYPNARTVENVLEEIELRKTQGFKAIFFDDSTFAAHPEHRRLLHALRKTGMVFGCLNRFNHLTDPKIVQEYADAGFRYVYCAIEQFDDNTLRLMQKSLREKQIAESMQLLHDEGLEVGVSLLYGLPGESEDSIRKTLDFTEEWVRKGTIKLVSESLLSYHPGTASGFGKVAAGFHRTPPNKGHPFDRFEEGQWYHPEYVTAGYLQKILDESEKRFSGNLVRNRHSWYARSGITHE